jgi:hypothetical protein
MVRKTTQSGSNMGMFEDGFLNSKFTDHYF